MGIINATPDSFFGGSRFNGVKEIAAEAEKMLNDGAGIIDIGGQSTRPEVKGYLQPRKLKRCDS